MREEGEHPHVEKAERYVADVLSGKIPACKTVKQACRRHKSDRARARKRDPSFPYRFDPDAAERICQFAEALPHVKGKWANRRMLITLGGWQCFILVSLFGWVKRKNGMRRFREALLLIPRKNGKSILAAIIGLFMWCMDGETGAEVYSGATSEKQAWEVFGPARLMTLKTQELMDELGCEVNAKSLIIPEDNSKFEPVIGKPGDGASPSCAIIDEWHEHQSSDLVDTMKTGMLAREQPLLLKISTAGNNLAGPCYDGVQEAKKILQGVFENEELFILMYGIDDDRNDTTLEQVDDWSDPAVLRKANPNFGISIEEDALLADQKQAVLNPVDQNRFRTKHLNVWCSAKTAWMPLVQWDLCGDPDLSLEEFKGQNAFLILDLASKDDIAALVVLVPKQIRNELHYYTFARYYLPEDALTSDADVYKPNQVAYRRWHAEGRLLTTPGAEIDFDRIAEDVLKLKDQLHLVELIYDPWRAMQLARQLEKEGATVVECRQTVQNLSAPMKELLSAVKALRIHHDTNPVTRWMMSNVVAQLDGKDNIYPRKEKPYMKIDGAVGLIMGLWRAMVPTGAGSIEGWLNSPVGVKR